MERAEFDTARAKAIELVRKWFSELPPGEATLSESSTDFEHILELTPTNTSACKLTFAFSSYGTMDVYPNRGNFDEMAISDELILEFCEAVRQGRVEEKTRECCGKTVSVKTTVVIVGKQPFVKRTTDLLGLLFPFGRTKRVVFEPWTRTREGEKPSGFTGRSRG